MSTSGSSPRRTDNLPRITCPFCSVVVPDGRYCGACGAHLLGEGPWHAQRLHSYAAFPDETVVRLSTTTTLFPHLSHRGRAPFRAALGILLALIVVFAIAGTAAPMVAVCAFGVPLLFFIYIFEVDPYEGSFIAPTAISLLIGAGLGIGWSLISSGYVNEALQPSATGGLGSGSSLVAGVLVPAVAAILMCVTIPIVRAMQRGTSESLDGFVVGASSALGFTCVSTIVLLRPWLSNGQLLHEPFLNTLTQGLIRGIAWPLISALATGLVGACFWATTQGRATAARGRWITSPIVALALSIVLQVGSALANLASFPNAQLLVVQGAIVAVLIVLMRVGIHHVLIHEAAEVTIGDTRVCAHCGHLVPTMNFCPQCGVANRAITRRNRVPQSPSIGPPSGEGSSP